MLKFISTNFFETIKKVIATHNSEFVSHNKKQNCEMYN